MDSKHQNQDSAVPLDPIALDFQPVLSRENIAHVAAMARCIWVEHFTPIIGASQVAYMLERFQSEQAVSTQISEDGYRYFLITDRTRNLGYTAVVPLPEKSTLLLSKLYIDRRFRNKGLGRAAVKHIVDIAKADGYTAIRLTVNRNNLSSIEAYRKFGFQIAAEAVQDIGAGFVMDDYIMTRDVSPISAPPS